MPALWPAVYDRLLDLAGTAVPDAQVFDGPPVGGVPPMRYVTVGYHDEDVLAGNFGLSRTPGSGWVWQEDGQVLCELVAATGDQALPRADVFVMFDAFAAAVAVDVRLGVLPPGGSSSLSVEAQSSQNARGAVQRLLVTVNYVCFY